MSLRRCHHVGALASLVLLGLGGCHYLLETPPPAAPPEAVATRVAPAALGETDAWWRAYGNAELDQLMAGIAEEHPTLREARGRLREARALVATQESFFWPELAASAEGSRTWRSENVGQFQGERAENRFGAFLDLEYAVDVSGRVHFLVESAEAQALAAQASYAHVRLALETAVVETFWRLHQAYEEQRIIKATIERRTAAYDLLRQLRDSGAANDLESAEALTSLRLAELDQVEVAGRVQQLRFALLALLGRLPESTMPLPTPDPVALTAFAVPAQVYSETLLRRPDVTEAEYLVQAAAAQVGVAKADFFPRIVLSADVGLESTSLSSLFETASLTGGFGPRLTLPVFQAGRLRGRLRQAKAEWEQLTAAYDNLILQAFRQVAQSLANLETLDASGRKLEEVEAAARRSVELATARFEAGVDDFFDVIELERILLEVELRRARVQGDRAAETVALVRALGGGWETHPP